MRVNRLRRVLPVLALAIGTLVLLQLQGRLVSTSTGHSPPAARPVEELDAYRAPYLRQMERHALSPTQPAPARRGGSPGAVRRRVAAVLAANASGSTAESAASDVASAGWCQRYARRHGVVPFQFWGSLSVEDRAVWTTLGCDALISGSESSARGPTALSSATANAARREWRPTVRRAPGGLRSRTRAQQPAYLSSADAPALPANASAWCAAMRAAHNVRVGTSWGTMDESARRTWVRLGCDQAEPGIIAARQKEAGDLERYGEQMAAALKARSADRRIRRTSSNAKGQNPAVAVCVCTTSRNTKVRPARPDAARSPE